MYKLTRQEVADTLKISTRSVDRYIKSWKLRSKKEWKLVLVNQDDIDNLLSNWWKIKQEVIIKPKIEKKEEKINISEDKETKVVKNTEISTWILPQIYKDLKEEIEKKDEIIQILSIRVWKAEEIAKNSIPVAEYKKSQFLLEESKWYLNKEVDELRKDKEKLNQDLKYEKTSNILLIIFVILLLVIAWWVWFIKI